METSILLNINNIVHNEETHQDIVTPPEWILENCLWAVWVLLRYKTILIRKVCKWNQY